MDCVIPVGVDSRHTLQANLCVWGQPGKQYRQRIAAKNEQGDDCHQQNALKHAQGKQLGGQVVKWRCGNNKKQKQTEEKDGVLYFGSAWFLRTAVQVNNKGKDDYGRFQPAPFPNPRYTLGLHKHNACHSSTGTQTVNPLSLFFSSAGQQKTAVSLL